MRIKIKFIVIIILLGGFTNVSVAQSSASSNPDSLAAKEARSLKIKLGLSESQATQISSATKSYRIESDSIQLLNIDTTQKKQLLKNSLHDYRVAMSVILTPEQFESYKGLIIQRRNSFRAWAAQHNHAINEIEDDF